MSVTINDKRTIHLEGEAGSLEIINYANVHNPVVKVTDYTEGDEYDQARSIDASVADLIAFARTILYYYA